MFQANFSGEVTAVVVVSSIFSIYRTSQLVMLEYSVRLRLELPTVYLCSALFSHSAGVLALACQHVLLTKKEVFPTLNEALRSLEMVGGYDSLNTSLGEDWLREGLYLSFHPALLPYVLEYLDCLDSLELGNSREKQLAWLQLSEEQDDQEQWEKNIRNIRNKITSY